MKEVCMTEEFTYVMEAGKERRKRSSLSQYPLQGHTTYDLTSSHWTRPPKDTTASQ
jgi:hypothetical protein